MVSGHITKTFYRSLINYTQMKATTIDFRSHECQERYGKSCKVVAPVEA